jgi:hypothetical protein
MSTRTGTGGRWRRKGALVIASAMVGALMAPPASAHFTQKTKHLGKHAWKQFIKAQGLHPTTLW